MLHLAHHQIRGSKMPANVARALLFGLALIMFGACSSSSSDNDETDTSGGTTDVATTEDTGTTEDPGTGQTDTGGDQSFTISSASFPDGEPVPTEYTCEGDDISPPLTWVGGPADTQSFALIVSDPDIPVDFPPEDDTERTVGSHWIVYDIPESVLTMPEDVATNGLPTGAREFWPWFGPCPPEGDIVHHYVFTLYALDKTFGIAPWDLVTTEPGADPMNAMIDLMADHILIEAQLTGTYQITE